MNDAKVYFVGAPGRIKIGFTRRPEKRLIALQRSDMEELHVIKIIDGSRFLERTLHGLLKDHRIRGEWYKDCAEVRQAIDDTIAGKYPIEEPAIIELEKPIIESEVPEGPRPFSREFQIIELLGDAAEKSLTRGDDKYEVRGRVESFLLAAQFWMERQAVRDRETEQKIHTILKFAERRRAEVAQKKAARA